MLLLQRVGPDPSPVLTPERGREDSGAASQRFCAANPTPAFGPERVFLWTISAMGQQ
jgi:hypothetical protein